MKKLTKVLSIVMLVAMCVSMFAGSAFADEHVCSNETLVHHEEIPASCKSDGTKEYYSCSGCSILRLPGGAEVKAAELVIPKLTGISAHSWTAVAKVDPTCKTTGTEAHSLCTVCGALEFGGEIVSASALTIPSGKHTPAATMIPAISATCSTDGNYAYYVCTTCGSACDNNGNPMSKTIPATGVHTYGDWIIDKAATAYDAGSKYRVCSGCGDIDTEVVDAEGVSREDAVHVLDHIGSTYWKSGMDPLQFYSNYYDIYAYSGTLKIDGKSIDRESYWANSEGVITLGTNLMSKLSAGKHSIQVVDTTDPRIDSNTLYFTVAATLKATDTDKHVINSSKSLKFVASDEIVSAKVGSIELTDKDDFKINGKYVTLYADFLNDRTAGSTYTLTVTTKGGETASTTFKILTTAQASASPRTGDDSNIALWSALVLMSGAAMIAVLPRLKKEQ